MPLFLKTRMENTRKNYLLLLLLKTFFKWQYTSENIQNSTLLNALLEVKSRIVFPQQILKEQQSNWHTENDTEYLKAYLNFYISYALCPKTKLHHPTQYFYQ